MILFRVTEANGSYGYMDEDMLSNYLEHNDDNISIDIIYCYEVQKAQKGDK